jgi:hypothetical protein
LIVCPGSSQTIHIFLPTFSICPTHFIAHANLLITTPCNFNLGSICYFTLLRQCRVVPRAWAQSQTDLGLCLGPTHCRANLDKVLNFFDLLFPHVTFNFLNHKPWSLQGTRESVNVLQAQVLDSDSHQSCLRLAYKLSYLLRFQM